MTNRHAAAKRQMYNRQTVEKQIIRLCSSVYGFNSYSFSVLAYFTLLTAAKLSKVQFDENILLDTENYSGIYFMQTKKAIIKDGDRQVYVYLSSEN